MALIVGNKTVQSVVPQYSGGALIGILVRVNRAIVDDATTPPTVKYGLATSPEVDIWPALTATQKTAATAFFGRLTTLMSSMAEFEA